MNLSNSISYRRFLKETYLNFSNQHFNDIVDYLEKFEDSSFDQYLKESEIKYEIEESFRFCITDISKDLGLNYGESLALEESNRISKSAYIDFVKYMKSEFKKDISDYAAYRDLAKRIK